MNNPKKSFILHLDSLCVLDEMTLEQKGILFDAIYNFQLGVEVELDFSMKMAFAPFRNQFIRDNEKYTQFIERQTNNGKKGGRKVETQANPENPSLPKEAKPTLNDSVSDSVNDNDSVKENDNESGSVKKENTHETFEPTIIYTSPEIEIQEQRKVAPKESNYVIYPIEEIEQRFKNWEFELWEGAMRNYQITKEEYEKGVDLFIYEQGPEKLKRDYGENVRHFKAWIKLNIKHIKNQKDERKFAGVSSSTIEQTFNAFKKKQPTAEN